jgi:CRP/FNR family transcriptional regulator
MRQASMSDYIYFIKEGMVKVHISSPRGKEQIIKIAQTGAFFGLSNLTNTRVNFYSVTAITDTTVCVIKKTFIEKLIKENGEFSFHLIKSVCEANIFTTTRLINTMHKQMNGRIADALLYLSETIYEDDEFELNLTRSDLGKFVGISRENFSRVLSQFSSDRIIEIEGKKCKIIDINRLKSISKLG